MDFRISASLPWRGRALFAAAPHFLPSPSHYWLKHPYVSESTANSPFLALERRGHGFSSPSYKGCFSQLTSSYNASSRKIFCLFVRCIYFQVYWLLKLLLQNKPPVDTWFTSLSTIKVLHMYFSKIYVNLKTNKQTSLFIWDDFSLFLQHDIKKNKMSACLYSFPSTVSPYSCKQMFIGGHIELYII